MRILLLTPKFPESFWGLNRIQSITGKDYVTPTLALPTLAALAPSRHDIVLVDENVEEIDFDLPCDLVGISCMSVQGPRAFEIAAAFRTRGRIVVMGGGCPTLNSDLCRPHADVLFLGEAERTWPKFLADFENGSWSHTYEEKEKIDMKDLPVPRFDLLKMDRYFIQAVQFSRGCPHNCEFCDIIVMLGRKVRTKAIPQLLAEIEEIYRLGGRRIFIVDDNFIGNRKKAKEVLAAIRDWNASKGFEVMFNTESTLDVANDDELLKLFHDARFVRLFIGIETPRRASLEETNKYMNLQYSIQDQIQKVQAYGIQITAGMIVGFDNDDESIFEEHRSFLEASRIPQVMSGMLQAPPRTPLHERLMREGRLYGEFMGDQFLTTNIVPKGMTREKLLQGYAELLVDLYDYDRYAARTIAFLTATRKCEPLQPKKKSWTDLKTLAKFMFYVLFRDTAERRRFARRILKATWSAYPVRLPEAVYLIVVHRHFHEFSKMCAKNIMDALASGTEEVSYGTSTQQAIA